MVLRTSALPLLPVSLAGALLTCSSGGGITLPLNPGDTAEYSLWTLEADNSTKVTPPLRASMVMPPTAPDPIGSSWAASDSVIASWNLDGPPYGRYVRLQFTIPEANGDDIQKFLIARNDGSAERP